MVTACASETQSTTVGTTTPGQAGFSPPPVGAVAAVVGGSVDGDTFRLDDGRSVRVLNVDTPETVERGVNVQCYGPEASHFTATNFPAGTEVLLEFGVEATDRYGRVLAYVWRASDGLFLNAALADGGYAQALIIPPNTARAEEISALVASAQAEQRGLWGACPN